MPDNPSLPAWLSLSLIKGLGGEGARTLLREFHTPEAVLSAPAAALSQHVKPSVAAAISHGIDDALLAPILQWCETPGNFVITLEDENYPAALLNIPDPPILLYLKGNIRLLNCISIAIVGSRNATAQGLSNAESFASALSHASACVVSGLAHGIDAAAHRGALRGTGSTIAIVGTGLDRVYPSANRELAHLIASDGALISEFPLGTPPIASNFPRRNRLISGLSLGCLVVEAGIQSGSLITAHLAAEQGREVYAIPGSIHSPMSKGTHLLLKQGAKLVETAQDILEDLSGQLGISPLTPATADSASLNSSFLLDHLGYDPSSIDDLALRSGLTLVELSAMLLQLELDGQVAVLPGGRYQRIS